jgi:acyl-CoA thioesterase FadM
MANLQRPDVAPALPHSVRLSTRWSDEDNHGVLNNAVYLTLMEEARRAQFEALGRLEGRRFPFVLAQANVRFVAPGRSGSDVLVEYDTTHVGTSSFRQSYRIRESGTGELWCEAEALLVCVDSEGRGRALDDDLRAALASPG